MELILTILLLVVIGVAYRAFFASVRAGARAVMGKGSFTDNFSVAFSGMQAIDARLHHVKLETLSALEVQIKGKLPISSRMNLTFITSVFDGTKEEWAAVASHITAAQEKHTRAYQAVTELGVIDAGVGFVGWVKIALIIPEALSPPYSGHRNLKVLVRLVDTNDPPRIRNGFHDPNGPTAIWAKTLELPYNFTEKGYLEEAEHRDESRALALKLGVAVALADGNITDAEGETLRSWIKRVIEQFSESRQAELKEIYNAALKESFLAYKRQEFSFSEITTRMNSIAERGIKYEAIELCLDVMFADGSASPEEIKAVRRIAEALDLDLAEIEKMKDSRLVSVDAASLGHSNIEELLGIDPSWDEAQIKKHLRQEFQKWNSRLNTLPEGEERQNAQRLLDLIAEARRKYG